MVNGRHSILMSDRVLNAPLIFVTIQERKGELQANACALSFVFSLDRRKIEICFAVARVT